MIPVSSQPVLLVPGSHPLRLDYFEASGEEGIEISSYSPVDGKWNRIPKSCFPTQGPCRNRRIGLGKDPDRKFQSLMKNKHRGKNMNARKSLFQPCFSSLFWAVRLRRMVGVQ